MSGGGECLVRLGPKVAAYWEESGHPVVLKTSLTKSCTIISHSAKVKLAEFPLSIKETITQSEALLKMVLHSQILLCDVAPNRFSL